MYNKHTHTKTEFQVIIENKFGISFNTEKKRKAFISRLKGTREITCMSNVEYPWNVQEGEHNLISVSDFAKRVGIKDVTRITKAIKSGKIKTEMVGNDSCIVIKNGCCYINGSSRNIEN